MKYHSHFHPFLTSFALIAASNLWKYMSKLYIEAKKTNVKHLQANIFNFDSQVFEVSVRFALSFADDDSEWKPIDPRLYEACFLGVELPTSVVRDTAEAFL